MPSLYVPGEPLEHCIQWLFPGKAFYKYSESGNDFLCIVYGQHPNAFFSESFSSSPFGDQDILAAKSI